MAETDGLEACLDHLPRKVEEWKTVPLNIAVIGNAKTGKSSFINAIRGLSSGDVGAADVGVVETTMVAEPHCHPDNPMLRFWDLPGLGTVKFSRNCYLELVDFAKYDFFVITISDTVTENDKWLLDEIAAKHKRCFIVRTKIDLHVQNDRHDHPRTHDPKRVVAHVMDNLRKNLGDLYDPDRVFLINNHARQDFDFEKLAERLLEDFPLMKREALILSMSTFSEEMVQKKVKVLRDNIGYAAATSAAVAAVPIPVVSTVVDYRLALNNSRYFHQQLGLDEESLKKLAKVMKCDVAHLSEIVDAESKQWLTLEGITHFISQDRALMVATKVATGFSFIPILGSLIAAPLSYYKTGQALNAILTRMETLALRVVKTAIVDGTKHLTPDTPGNARGKPKLWEEAMVWTDDRFWPVTLSSACAAAVFGLLLSMMIDLGLILLQSMRFYHHLELDEPSLKSKAKITKCSVTRLRQVVSTDLKQLPFRIANVLVMRVVLVPMVSVVMTGCFPFGGSMLSVLMSCLCTCRVLNEIWKEMDETAVKMQKTAVEEGA